MDVFILITYVEKCDVLHRTVSIERINAAGINWIMYSKIPLFFNMANLINKM